MLTLLSANALTALCFPLIVENTNKTVSEATREAPRWDCSKARWPL
ncbi:MAG: hypothetical protein JJLCMIEE_00755 [Acidimicrobiales bacterium]|nr:hypothetical protein [Acidimicrobiales bacterium]